VHECGHLQHNIGLPRFPLETDLLMEHKRACICNKHDYLFPNLTDYYVPCSKCQGMLLEFPERVRLQPHIIHGNVPTTLEQWEFHCVEFWYMCSLLAEGKNCPMSMGKIVFGTNFRADWSGFPLEKFISFHYILQANKELRKKVNLESHEQDTYFL
jgi:hypothetical protein